MKITIVAFEGCMTSAVFGQADAFAVAAYIIPDIIRLLNSRDASEALRAMTEGRAPGFTGQ
jgi:hypothetical protein